MMKKLLLVPLCCVALFACRKEDPQPRPGTPVFYVNGTLDGAPVALRAGVDGYYMYSSYSSDASDIYTFEGELREQDCPSPCPGSFAVHVRDYATHTSQQTDIAISLAPGLYDFVSPQAVGNTVQFTAEPFGDSTFSFSWSFGDNQTSTQPNPLHVYANPGMYTVCLNMTDGASCTSMICDTVIVGGTCNLTVDFTATSMGGDSLGFDATPANGTAPYSYTWSFGDFTTATGEPIVHDYTTPDVYMVRVEVTDGNSCTAVKRRNVQPVTNSECMANFSWQAQSGPSPEFSKVVIEWTDASGNVYTSADPQQPSTSTFEIVSVEEYQLNGQQQRTKKVHMRVNCTLYNGTNTLLLENADIVFALAYP